ncbi:hypothetical protein HPB51_025368 [Rhipicephalus microplus]|uniref:Uncharacterized protein n=1 Tax=Rhipicephalus microplus TaxID=6941 RepID=A0A9J6EDL3_RHIMP|nr:hypothetical protein HPB51_025368 [Rhipicephalus microplus]
MKLRRGTLSRLQLNTAAYCQEVSELPPTRTPDSDYSHSQSRERTCVPPIFGDRTNVVTPPHAQNRATQYLTWPLPTVQVRVDGVDTPILTEFAHRALPEASDAPQANDSSISHSGIIPLRGSDSYDGQVNMTSSLPAECRVDHHETAFLNGEYDADRSDGDQLARSSEMTPLYNPGVCIMVYSHGGVHLYGRRGTEPSDSILLLKDRRTRECGDGTAELPRQTKKAK